ncbi:MAG: Sapep family Mn(2+)-dependent dipeptidase [Clostridiales bacterium]|nr:Sapep family Mn(2+)-dependent dipeptidase [Clostridiales bacterium]
MKYKDQFDRYMEEHRQEMIEDICELCAINSEKMPAEEEMPYGPGAAECLDAALDMAEGYGFEVQDYDGYVGCVDFEPQMKRQLDILAHLDVVPAGEGWTVTEPFCPLVKDGRIYGRGTADDKGPVVAALYAMRMIRELGIPLKRNVRLILGTDEECGSSDIRYYYAKEPEAPMTFSPDGDYPVVNVEKGRLQGHFTAEFTASEALPRLVSVNVGVKCNVVPGKAEAVVEGFAAGLPEAISLEAAIRETEAATGVRFEMEPDGNRCRITAVGKGAHASTPEDGNNALTGLLSLLVRLPFADCPQVEALRKLEKLMPHGDWDGAALGVAMSDEVSGPLTLAFSMLTVTAEHVDAQFDSRVPICGNEENVLFVIRERLAAAGFTLHNDSMVPPHYVDGNTAFVRTLLDAYELYTGRKGECLSMGGGTYVHDLKNGVAFGASMPETDNRMHGADEFAVIDELVTSAKIFAQAIVGLCG